MSTRPAPASSWRATLGARLSRWRLSGLERRIVWPFLLLLLLVQGLSLLLVQHAIGESATQAIERDLNTGQRVFDRLLQQRAERLSEAASLLSSDFGFRAAVNSRDVATLSDALDNHGRRIGASLVIYADPAWRPLASTGLSVDRVASLLPAARLSAMATATGAVRQARLVLIEGRPYQVVAVPVKSPRTVGWVLMGFVLDRSVLLQLSAITDLRGAILSGGPPTRPLLTTFELAHAELTRPDTTQPACGRELHEPDGRWRSCEFVLDTGPTERAGGPPLRLVLAHSVNEAVAPFERLRLTLLLLTVVGVLVFAVGSAMTARRLSRPLRGLRRAAERLGQADYDTPVRVPDERQVGDELVQLARAFESMRQAVQHREQTIGRLAYWDTLTGLPNRAQFIDALRGRLNLRDAAGREPPLAVLMLDLDRFKHVNDVLGHPLGDRLLCEVAQRLAGCCRMPEAAVLARLSGDEFGLLLPGADEAQAQAMGRRLLGALDEPLRLDDHVIDLSASLGIAFAPLHANEPEALLGLVEVAMYAAKRRQMGLLVYETSMDTRSSASLSLLSELREAIEQQALRLYVQPKVDLKTGRVLGGEALVRWQHPQRGLVPPMQFIPFAEQTGFIRHITAWMLEVGVASLQRWQEAGQVLKLSINLSTRDLLDPALPDRVRELLDRHRVSAGRLCLEITESAIMDDPARALQTLQKLHELGVRLSIDDFGTGYSSLAYLKRLPVDELKIDRSFVTNMERDLDDARIVQSTIGLAHNLGLTVVAEGVETDKAWGLLARLGCDEGQGYGIGRPMPSDEFLGWVARWRAPTGEALHIDTDFAEML